MTTINPILSEVTRGHAVESQHRGVYAVCDAEGRIVVAAGDIKRPIFPRSAIKAFQCLPLIESGAADHFGLSDEEIALCCSSHNGETEHVRVATSILAKAGIGEDAYECGAHWPERVPDKLALGRAGEEPRAIHNNCSGKHAGMLALAKHMNAPLEGYTKLDHPVQKVIAETLDAYCGVETSSADVGIDGCSVPTWALPLENLALGFAKLFSPGNKAGERMANAARAHPFMIAGTGRFDTRIMEAVPRLFIKVGAEGVFCGAVPEAGLGFALKVDDGAIRGAEVAVAKVLAALDCWSTAEKDELQGFAQSTLRNWRKLEVGEARASF
jgi:L-asparaginase II